MLKEIKDLPGALEEAKQDLRRASVSIVEAGEATQNAMIGVATVALLALVLSVITIAVVRRATS
jgi:hypothetical protein